MRQRIYFDSENQMRSTPRPGVGCGWCIKFEVLDQLEGMSIWYLSGVRRSNWAGMRQKCDQRTVR